MGELGGLIRNTVVVLLAVAMGLLILLAVRSLVAPVSDAAPPPTGTAVESLPEAAGPATTITFGIGQLTGTVSCFRAAAGTEGGGSFYVQLIDPVGEAADLAVGVALIEPDGGRQQRTIELEPTSPGEPMLGPVADSADPGRFVDCTVIAVQRDQQVILTGN